MTINVIGDCDKRPVLYTILKIAQTLGDVLLVTNRAMLRRLSDTGETGGFYQNIMIAVTQDGIDDFFDSFEHQKNDFNTVIIDNIVAAESDVFVYVKGLNPTPEELELLETLENYEVIDMYKGKFIDSKTYYNIEEFEALRDCCPMNAELAKAIGEILGPVLKKDPKNIAAIAMTRMPNAPKPKAAVLPGNNNKGSKKKFSLGGLLK